MKKSNLKEHDIVILRDESVFMLYKIKNELHLISAQNYFSDLSNYNYELKYDGLRYDDSKNEHDDPCDIVEVKRPTKPDHFITNRWQKAPTIWKRNYALLSKDEYYILKNINPIYKFISRDKDKNLYVFEKKPQKKETVWNEYTDSSWLALKTYNHIFKFIKWENNEPYFIPDLLKKYEDYKKEN